LTARLPFMRPPGGTSRRVGLALVVISLAAAVGAPVLAPHALDLKFGALQNAPPTVPHFVDDQGTLRAPFIYPWRLVNQLEQIYEQDRSAPVPLSWFKEGHLVRSSNEAVAPLMLLGADSYGRDVFSRLMFGGRTSLTLAVVAALGAMMIGCLIGGIAGYAGGATDDALMRMSDFVLVLPGMYVALALRSVLPIVLGSGTVFAMLAAIFAVVGAPYVSRGVRGIIRTEARLDYASAAASLGASRTRILARHLLPAARGFLIVEMTMLVPAFIVAEATLSYVGLGFPESVSSWGTMLHDASGVRAFADFPWLLSPAAAMFVVVLGVNLMFQERHTIAPQA
jgi:peptide/nickel transport system permease protein